MDLLTNHWSLGLFAVVGLVLTVCTMAVLGARIDSVSMCEEERW
jgi:hypothetical protein